MRFDSYHPTINLIFFASVIICAIAFDHPIALAVGWSCSFAYSVKLNGKRALIFDGVLLLFVLAFAIFYANYTHFGLTVIGKNAIGNSYTLESFVVGIVIGLKAAIVIMWLSCMHAVFSTDKIVYLFGRVSPKLSLSLAIALRAVPRLKGHVLAIEGAQRGVGRAVVQGNLFARARNAVRIVSIAITWFMESAITAADSMRSRGLGLPHRSAFSLYRFDARDRSFVIALFVCLSLLLAGYLLDQMNILYDPEIIMNRMTPASGVFFAAYALLCLMPLLLQVHGEWRFDRLRGGLDA